MRLNIWEHPSNSAVKRVYINGIDGLNAKQKAYLMPVAGGGSMLKVYDESTRATIMAHLNKAGVIPPGGISALRFRDVARFASNEPSSTPESFGAPKISSSWKPDMAEELDLSTIPVPDPVTIRIDHREPAELFEKLRGLKNVTVENAKLCRLVISRSTANI